MINRRAVETALRQRARNSVGRCTATDLAENVAREMYLMDEYPDVLDIARSVVDDVERTRRGMS